ncbi:MAG: hypothetical protein ACFFAT_18025 [Promethearchaeota archaeon]
MGKIFHRFLLILGIFIAFMCTITFFMNGGIRKWDELICINLIRYTLCTSFLIFMITWIASMVIIFFAILMIKGEL